MFDMPCGADEAYHGYKPTCWRPWPSPAAAWRDERCGAPPAEASGYPMRIEGFKPSTNETPVGPTLVPRPAEPDSPANLEAVPVEPLLEQPDDGAQSSQHQLRWGAVKAPSWFAGIGGRLRIASRESAADTVLRLPRVEEGRPTRR